MKTIHLIYLFIYFKKETFWIRTIFPYQPLTTVTLQAIETFMTKLLSYDLKFREFIMQEKNGHLQFFHA